MFRKLGLMLVPVALLTSAAFAGDAVIAYHCAARYLFYETPPAPATSLDDATLPADETATVLAKQMEFGIHEETAQSVQMQVYFYKIDPEPDPNFLPANFPLDTTAVGAWASPAGGTFPNPLATANAQFIGGYAVNYALTAAAGNYTVTVTLTGLSGGGFTIPAAVRDYACELVFVDPTTHAMKTDVQRWFTYGTHPSRGVNKDAFAEDVNVNGVYDSATEFAYFGGYPYLSQHKHGVYKAITSQLSGFAYVETLYSAIITTPGFQLFSRPIHISVDGSDEMNNGATGLDNNGVGDPKVQQCATFRYRLANGATHTVAVRVCGFLRQKISTAAPTGATISGIFDRSGNDLQTGDGDEDNCVSDGDIINHILDFDAAPGSSSGYPCDDGDGDEFISDGDIIVDILNFGSCGDPM